METLRTLPGDDVRQILWRYADRFDLQMAVQSARSIARSVVARLVADGVRNTHEWTERKAELLKAFDESGLTSIYMDPAQGGFIEGPKNLALALVAMELAWVDGGAATSALASCLGLAPIHEKGTDEQRAHYLPLCTPPQPGEDRVCRRAAFALTEPLPYVGVDTGILGGKMRVQSWDDGAEPLLKVEKRGRFITNMDFADIVTAAVESDDPRIKGSCMIILEKDDPGTFDRGAPTLKMVHQLSSTRDPVMSLTVPASRIIGGYDVVDGVIVPRFSHGEIIASVFHRTRIPVGLMTSAKLLSAIEPIIRYHRQRFRGGSVGEPGSRRHELGLQMNEDALQRLVDVWATGEAGCSLGLAAARLADRFDPIEREKDRQFAAQGIKGRKQLAALKDSQERALEYVRLKYAPAGQADPARLAELEADTLAQFVYMDALAGVLNPATKLWNTGVGATMMREAVSLVGGYGITEDCPGFLCHKWMDAQLEATYEGPEAVQRRHLTLTMTNPVFLELVRQWSAELRRSQAGGAAALAGALDLWLWTLDFLQNGADRDGKKLYHGKRQGVTFPLADALGWLLAARSLMQDVAVLAAEAPASPVLAEAAPGLTAFYADMACVQAARAAGEAARVCAELVYGYGCGQAQDGPGGPCIVFTGSEEFARLRQGVDQGLHGTRLAKDRAAEALTAVMIPEALDYPL
ncbi:acyl-CoA dehydrogenase family protein [Desulfocurvus vexinensis]|uniref:acyl-CoA dehydrogenase family protein n=1 Tax=Desulfocurvus vexinensis TaxID=399548 RepID=UPI000491B012|nr:acyl-CoA dehydrogenase family protein [Desulfocurvus vexinensis]